MTSTDEMAAQLKRYEWAGQQRIAPRSYMMVRVDGRAFHTLLKNADKPFDWNFVEQMERTMKFLCKQVTGTKLAYSQSDEVSLLVYPQGPGKDQVWFDGVVQKIASVAASAATLAFNGEGRYSGGMFDARVYTLPDMETVEQYFVWRQADATRNSLSMLAHAHYKTGELHGKKGPQIHEMLHDKGFNWNDLEPWVKRGAICRNKSWKADYEFVNTRTGESETAYDVVRHLWVSDAAPIFARGTDDWLPEPL